MAFSLKSLLKSADTIGDEIPISQVPLTKLIDMKRQDDMLRRESYYRGTQHDHKQWTFDGVMIGVDGGSEIFATDYVPMKSRRPSCRMDLPKVIVDRLFSLVFGGDHFPQIMVEDDEDAQDFSRELAKESCLPIRMLEAGQIGGSTGTAVLSFGFVDGKPLVEVHKSAFCEVLSWKDWPRRKPSSVLKSYKYEKRVLKPDGSIGFENFYYARYWDEQIDITWKEIPEYRAQQSNWTEQEYQIVRHNSGICPVYWIQNLPDSSDIDGASCFENQESDFDEIDLNLSATSTGTKANVDPTLVVHDQKGHDDMIRKGTGHVIYSENGASYLELSGSAVETSLSLVEKLRQYNLDKSCVVLQDPDRTGSGPQSNAAMRTRYQAMTTRCDVLREQYGKKMVDMLIDMLEMSRKLSEPKQSAEGEQYWSKVELKQRVETEGEGENKKVKLVDRKPGTSSNVTLNWPPYFPLTWEDISAAVQTAKDASGGKPVICRKTAVESIIQMFGKNDAEKELEDIEEDEEKGMEKAEKIFAKRQEGTFGAGPPGKMNEGDEDNVKPGKSRSADQTLPENGRK